jgi:creatinine amidohydrolase
MMRRRHALPLLVVLTSSVCADDHAAAPDAPPTRGVELAKLTWPQAERVLQPDTVVVIPLGAAAKEHGPHLRLDNDLLLASYFAGRVLAAADVVVAPTIAYHHYPAFVEYPGSTSLGEETARDLVVEICDSLARFGPRRFYVLNTGISTVPPLQAAADVLAARGITLRFTELPRVLGAIEREISQQERGSHADEIETSMILYIDPTAVDMTKAVRDDRPKHGRGFNRTEGGPGTYSPSGVWGDATLATREKGERVVEAMVAAVLADIEALRAMPMPAG